ncbi:hypothetical protein C4B63_235g1 [Trypanosoma cruzi]|uniref:Rhodanese domain-containing protein n=1 Tax=Trypanosoma cruzi TaxID=5693 RepID=A0A2V2UJX8_TRYCR|nr:hypothetical protein C4B63_235g1 [Trypanosoma cruzi]
MEVQSTGLIPTAINIPLDELESALKADHESFQKTYAVSKPLQDHTLVMYCKKGLRGMEGENAPDSVDIQTRRCILEAGMTGQRIKRNKRRNSLCGGDEWTWHHAMIPLHFPIYIYILHCDCYITHIYIYIYRNGRQFFPFYIHICVGINGSSRTIYYYFVVFVIFSLFFSI